MLLVIVKSWYASLCVSSPGYLREIEPEYLKGRVTSYYVSYYNLCMYTEFPA